jgi:hypothetical protein
MTSYSKEDFGFQDLRANEVNLRRFSLGKNMQR